MMFSFFKFFYFILCITGIELDYGPLHFKGSITPTKPTINDDFIIRNIVDELHSITNATDLNECISCKMRLLAGKSLAFTRPDLIPLVYSEWCLEMGYDETKCLINFGYPSINYSSEGNDFTQMIQLMNPEGLDGDLFCYFHDSKCHILPEMPKLSKVENLWPPKPRLYDSPKSSGEFFNVLHVSDLNLQTDYKTLSESNCSQSICCYPQSFNKEPPPSEYDYSPLLDPEVGLSFYDSTYENGHFQKGQFLDMYTGSNHLEVASPKWIPCHEFGSYNCDSPELLINNTLQIIRDFHENHLNFEFGIFTGGMMDHNEKLFTDKYQVLNTQLRGYNDIFNYLDTFPIFPTFGVRDNFPVNQLPQNSMDTVHNFQWQFDFLSDLWQELGWIDLRASKQIRYNKIGYSMITERGLKIISLNSNVWSAHNLYSFVDSLNFDPFGIWRFLTDELIDSEINEQRVWIISHLPPSRNSLPVPTKVFTKIIKRFSPKVIAAIFFGHNLNDEFNLIYGGDGTDKNLSNLINYALVGPSISPFKGNNPSWRYYSVDTESFEIINSFTYFTKLNYTFINSGAEPIWEFEYSARDAFDPENLWSVERNLDMEFWHHVGEKIRDLPEINQLYTRIQRRYSPFDDYDYDFNSSSILNNDNYCKVSSFTVFNQKECMLTNDQDDYIRPEASLTYIPIIKPYEPPEYELYSIPDPTQNSPEEYHDFQLPKSEPFVMDEPVDTIPLPIKKSSMRDRVHNKHKEVKKELFRRDVRS
ncbi:hypothetical protein CLIB1444_02S03092 [[Candida] jaroonii]|uniref:Uncharacterized protein n=1 Tax=[Candida] jaroonii TaxID=467808 RepID=A0ACA9Y2M8_9ASCO|nr:hypothetical protein CLIB1444_02S03092 [[Candida] jaroonii]